MSEPADTSATSATSATSDKWLDYRRAPKRDKRDMLPVVYDKVLTDQQQAELYEFLLEPGWEWGWRSNTRTDHYRFWHKHFAGQRSADRKGQGKDGKDEILYRGTDCAQELKARFPLIWSFWNALSKTLLQGHTLVRCYANGLPYGNDGTVHTDSIVEESFTTIYYPHAKWDPNWGGETMFFSDDRSEIIAVSYPKPGRLVTFCGTIPHVARGVSRTCPILRITLMFKTEVLGA